MDFTMIASVGEKGELGKSGDLCWHIREDLAHFKTLTMGGIVIMGRKTWESLPKKPLPGRINVVVTSAAGDQSSTGEGVQPHLYASSLKEALDKVYAGEKSTFGREEPAMPHPVFIIGGASIYSQAMPQARKLEITRILASDPEADTFFPEINMEEWRLEMESPVMTSESNPKLSFRYQTYVRR